MGASLLALAKSIYYYLILTLGQFSSDLKKKILAFSMFCWSKVQRIIQSERE